MAVAIPFRKDKERNYLLESSPRWPGYYSSPFQKREKFPLPDSVPRRQLKKPLECTCAVFWVGPNPTPCPQCRGQAAPLLPQVQETTPGNSNVCSVVQWLQTYLPIQGTQIRSLVCLGNIPHAVGQLSQCTRTTKPWL